MNVCEKHWSNVKSLILTTKHNHCPRGIVLSRVYSHLKLKLPEVSHMPLSPWLNNYGAKEKHYGTILLRDENNSFIIFPPDYGSYSIVLVETERQQCKGTQPGLSSLLSSHQNICPRGNSRRSTMRRNPLQSSPLKRLIKALQWVLFGSFCARLPRDSSLGTITHFCLNGGWDWKERLPQWWEVISKKWRLHCSKESHP